MVAASPARPCPLCSSDNSRQPVLPYSVAPWALKRCAACGLVYLENPPAYSSLEEEFAYEKTWAEEDQRRRSREPLLYHSSRALQAVPKRLLRRDKLVALALRYFPPGRVLDVGCGDGSTLNRLPAPFIPFGIEVSKELSRRAQERFAPRGGRVVQADALSGLEQFGPGSFDGVVMISFLEHEASPRQALQSAMRVMKPAARLIVKVPNYASWNRAVRGARWCGFRFPDHVNYFTPGLLRRLLEESGLRVLRFGLADRFPTSDNMWMVAERP